MKNDVDFSIRLTNLSKIYSADEGRTPAIESLTLSVTKGQVFGILGSNEAGKNYPHQNVGWLDQANGRSDFA